MSLEHQAEVCDEREWSEYVRGYSKEVDDEREKPDPKAG